MELDLLPVFVIKASGILISHPFFDVYIYLGILAMAFASASTSQDLAIYVSQRFAIKLKHAPSIK